MDVHVPGMPQTSLERRYFVPAACSSVDEPDCLFPGKAPAVPAHMRGGLPTVPADAGDAKPKQGLDAPCGCTTIRAWVQMHRPMPLQFRWRTVGSRNPLRPRNRPRQAIPAAAGSPTHGPRGAAGRRPPSTRCICPGCAAGVKEGIPGCRQGSPAGSDTTRRDATGPGGAIRAAGVERGIRRTPGPLSRADGAARPRRLMAPAPSGRGSRTAETTQGRPCRTLQPRPRPTAGTVGGSRAPGRTGRRSAHPFPTTGSEWPELPRVATDRGYSRVDGTLYKMSAGPSGGGSGAVRRARPGRSGQAGRGPRGVSAAVGERAPAGGATGPGPSAIRRTSDSGPN